MERQKMLLTTLATPSPQYLTCPSTSSAMDIGDGRVFVLGPDQHQGYSCYIYSVVSETDGGQPRLVAQPLDCPIPRRME
ncbi:hypothetical protein KIPB_009384, partial [Kipferlia bialata]|eukprot:g9384.t1